MSVGAFRYGYLKSVCIDLVILDKQVHLLADLLQRGTCGVKVFV